MAIQYKTLRRSEALIGLGLLPTLIALFFIPGWDVYFDYILFALIVIAAALNIAIRTGLLRIVFSPADRETTQYRIWQRFAVREREVFGSLFSNKYYESFDLNTAFAKDDDGPSDRK